jgi:hypothetical protein
LRHPGLAVAILAATLPHPLPLSHSLALILPEIALLQAAALALAAGLGLAAAGLTITARQLVLRLAEQRLHASAHLVAQLAIADQRLARGDAATELGIAQGPRRPAVVEEAHRIARAGLLAFGCLLLARPRLLLLLLLRLTLELRLGLPGLALQLILPLLLLLLLLLEAAAALLLGLALATLLLPALLLQLRLALRLLLLLLLLETAAALLLGLALATLLLSALLLHLRLALALLLHLRLALALLLLLLLLPTLLAVLVFLASALILLAVLVLKPAFGLGQEQCLRFGSRYGIGARRQENGRQTCNHNARRHGHFPPACLPDLLLRLRQKSVVSVTELQQEDEPQMNDRRQPAAAEPTHFGER